MEDRTNYMASCHPITGFSWYLLVIICAVMFQHPVYILLTLAAAILNYLSMTGRKGIKIILGFFPVFILLSLLNPLFNTYGEHVLFTYFGRPYTLEALCYGIVIAAMFVSMLLLFMAGGRVVTSDKFTALFGKMIPALSLLLVMVLRLVPSYRRKAKQIIQARACIGKGLAGNAGFKEKAENGMIILGALTGWALESSVVTADSMRSRGYGSSDRTCFRLYQFRRRDLLFLIFFGATFAGTIAGMVLGTAKAIYTPVLQIEAVKGWKLLPLAAYLLLLFLPIILNYLEEIKWHILRSEI